MIKNCRGNIEYVWEGVLVIRIYACGLQSWPTQSWHLIMLYTATSNILFTTSSSFWSALR